MLLCSPKGPLSCSSWCNAIGMRRRMREIMRIRRNVSMVITGHSSRGQISIYRQYISWLAIDDGGPSVGAPPPKRPREWLLFVSLLFLPGSLDTKRKEKKKKEKGWLPPPELEREKDGVEGNATATILSSLILFLPCSRYWLATTIVGFGAPLTSPENPQEGRILQLGRTHTRSRTARCNVNP